MTCEVCGHNAFHAESVERTFHVGEKLIVVEGIPGEVYDRCGAANFASDVAEQLRLLVHRPARALRCMEAEVLEFTAA